MVHALLTCFLAVPRVVLLTCESNISSRMRKVVVGRLTLVAKRKEQRDSLRWLARGERFSTIYSFE